MEKKIFLWLHMHQPDYLESLTGKIVLPWVRRHLLNGYYSIPALLLKSNFKANINFSGILLEQIKRYQNGEKDVFASYENAEPDTLGPSDIAFMVDRFDVPSSFKSERFSSIKEKFKKEGKLMPQEVLDLQVIFKLSSFAPLHEEVIELKKKGRNFSKEEKNTLINLENHIIGHIFTLYKILVERGQVEITVTPHHHPILPILVDINVAKESKSDAIIPDLSTRFIEDIDEQVNRAITLCKEIFNTNINGMWPAEGGISYETIDLLKSYPIQWIGSDELIVRPFGLNQGVYEYNGMRLFLRNHVISDKIGFAYNKMDRKVAVEDLMENLQNSGLLILILDGENPWEYYEDYGIGFLQEFFNRFDEKHTALGSEIQEAKRIEKIRPGSWINGYFDTWIGCEETNKAWSYLIEARRTLHTKEAFEELLKAEASDYFWWYSDLHKREINFDFDFLFRGRLIKAYKEEGHVVPDYLFYPIKTYPIGGN